MPRSHSHRDSPCPSTPTCWSASREFTEAFETWNAARPALVVSAPSAAVRITRPYWHEEAAPWTEAYGAIAR